MLRLQAPAKVNLTLRILAQERSGFHQLETLLVSLGFGDTLEIEQTEGGVDLQVDGLPCGSLEENLAYRAARLFLSESGVEAGIRIRLEKRIPVGAGLGGGSSDAGTTLRGLRLLFPRIVEDDRLFRLAGTLGSDVPFFLSPSPLTLAWGRGDRLHPLPVLPEAPVLLALPPTEISTAEAYRALARKRKGAPSPHAATLFSPEAVSSWEEVGSLAVNDFEEVVFPIYPHLEAIRDGLRKTGPLIALLSGSGAALFGLYGSEEDASSAKAELDACFPDTRFVLTTTRSRTPGAQSPGVETGVGV